MGVGMAELLRCVDTTQPDYHGTEANAAIILLSSCTIVSLHGQPTYCVYFANGPLGI